MLVAVSEITPMSEQRKRCIQDIITVYNSNVFTNVKNNTMRTIDLLFKLGYYENSESFFSDKEIK